MKAPLITRFAAVAGAIVLLSGCAIGGPAAPQPADGSAAADSRPGSPVSKGFNPAVVKACDTGSSKTLAAIKDRGTLNWGIGVSPPFGYKNADGSWAGVEADNAQELAALLGVKVQIQDYDYGVMTTAMQTGKADILGAQLFITAERAKAIGFSDAYYLSGQLFYVLKDSRFQSIEDLNQADVRFVYGTGTAQGALAEKYIPKATNTDAPLRGQLLLYEFLASKQTDASMVEAAPMPVLLQKYTNPPLAAIGLKGRVTTAKAQKEDIIDPFEVAFGLPKDDAGFKSCIDAWVNDARTSGRMDERIQYWLDKKGE